MEAEELMLLRLHPGDTSMNRILGLAVAIVVPFCLSTAAHAQSAYYGVGPTGPVYGGYANAGQPYGGFGLEYSPAVPAGGIVIDQYGLLHAVPYVASASPVVVQPQPQVRTTRSGSRRAIAQPRYQLPTGSLGWSGGNGGMLYPVQTRGGSYGSGYDVGPYGVIDHNMMWKW
jgi:hypothetical protein